MFSNNATLRQVIYLLGVFINAVMAGVAASNVKIPTLVVIVLGGQRGSYVGTRSHRNRSRLFSLGRPILNERV